MSLFPPALCSAAGCRFVQSPSIGGSGVAPVIMSITYRRRSSGRVGPTSQ
jgi:hypothetical protein